MKFDVVKTYKIFLPIVGRGGFAYGTTQGSYFCSRAKILGWLAVLKTRP